MDLARVQSGRLRQMLQPEVNFPFGHSSCALTQSNFLLSLSESINCDLIAPIYPIAQA